MKYVQCIKMLKVLLNATDPADQVKAIQNFAAAVSLVDWVTQESEKASGQFAVFLAVFENFALPKEDEARPTTREQCLGELFKLPMHLPKGEE